MTQDLRNSLTRSRLLFIGIVVTLLAVVALLNRNALWHHPAWTPPGPNGDLLQPVPMDTPVSEVTFAIFDTETTGIDEYVHRLVELAVVKYRDGKEQETRSWLINPERFIPEEVVAVHHITAEMVADQPTFSDIYPEFLEFVDGCVLMAHNAFFDVKFLRREFARADAVLPALPVLDSLRLFKTWFPGQPSYSLGALAEQLEVDVGDDLHRAAADSLYIGLVMDKGLASRGGETTLQTLYDDAGGALSL